MPNYFVEHNVLKTNIGNNLPALGISTISSFGPYLLINNLDHNIEISNLEDSILKPISIYSDSIYPEGSDDASFDLDIHSFIYSEALNSLLILNHFGRLLFIDSRALVNKHEPQFILMAQSKWLGDVEQSLLINNCLVSTSPGGYHIPEPAAPGLFISQPLVIAQGKSIEESIPKCIDYNVHFANRGIVTAIAKSDNFLAVAFGQKILLLRLSTKNDQLLAADPIVQEFKVDFHTRYLSFVEQKFLICAGHDIGRTESPTDWTALNGGGFVVLDLNSQNVVSHNSFNQKLAWGNGGQCLAVFRNNSDIFIIGVDSQANLYSWHWQTGLKQILFQSLPENKSLNYGISHFVWHGGSLLCGFNRDGNRLHKYTVLDV